MAIFDIEKNDLLRLSEDQLEELVFRLAEAEVAAHGHSPACVDWSGPINAPDEKIDIHVKVAAPKPNTGFLVEPNTILQSKKSKMPKGKIFSEMRTKDGKLHPTLSQQAKIGGGYIIVSLEDDCSPPMKEDRLAAMRAAVSGDPNKDKIDLNFFDRSKLVQWLRQHPSVMVWVKGKLGQGYSGWQPYGSWSNPPKGAKDTLILAPGVSVQLPTERGQNVPIKDAIEPMRDLIRFSSRAIRITGLSGVGKTRIVQALFDETVGINALDRTVAMYVDTSAEPDPSASAMLDELIADNRRAIMIVDDCPPNLHSSLASKVSAASGDVSLITVEYDIKDDKPYLTEVIHIETNGPEVAKELLLRRFPSIGEGNARIIAEFADGNAKVSLAIAERVQEGESLARLSDDDLFNRLFEQRKGREGILREQAEVLSLVYSFSVDPDLAPNELEVLGSISGHSYSQLFRSVNTMTDRHIIQKRSDMRAIMPHAIANRLAASGLNNITVATLRATFEASGHHRLLMSFAHRLGLMHDHAIAKEIVEAWLQPDGLLGQISNLDETESMILNCIGPVAPEALLNRIEAELTLPDFQGLQPLHNPPRTTILNLLRSLAYESQAFDRCIKLLIDLADNEDEDNIHDAVRDKISRFFQPYLSGTHASLVQRLAILDECLGSEKAGRRSLGITLLSTALDGPQWPGSGLYEFGARPRDYGYQPNHGQLVEWRSAFVDVVVRLTTSDDPDLRNRLSQVLADKFRGLWRQEAMREKLITAAKQINNHQPWTEGWKAIRSMIYDHTERNDKQDPEMSLQSLIELDKEFEPSDLVSIIQTYIFGKEYGNISDYYDKTIQLSEKIPELGKQFAVEGHHLDELGPDLFENNFMPYRSLFGKGLAIGAHDLRIVWTDIVRYLEQSSGSCDGLGIIREFFKEVASIDFGLSREFLDECATHSKLRRSLVELYPYSNFSESDLDRCMTILDDDETPPCMFGHFFWRDHYAHLPSECLVNLAKRILIKPEGSNVLLDSLTMKLHGTNTSRDTLGHELRRLGLQAAIQSFRNNHRNSEGSKDDEMSKVIRETLSFDGNEVEKEQWLNTIFSVVDDEYGCIHSFEEAIEITAELMPDAFLDRFFEGNEEQQGHRLFFIRYGHIHRLPLFKVKSDDLIAWCQNRHQAGDWGLVASGIQIWENNAITPLAIKFLEAAPDPRIVLQKYADSVTQQLWSESRANIMQSGADAIKKLTQHKRVDIANAAKLVLERLEQKIEQERIHKQ